MAKKSKQSAPETQGGSNTIWLATTAVLLITAVAVVAFVMFGQTDETQSIDNTTVSLQENDTHVMGNPDALNTLVVYSDFGCIHCANLHPLIVRFVEEHGEDYNYEIAHFPINNNVFSRMAAAAAYAAGRQGKYWEMVDVLYVTVDRWRSENGLAEIEQIAAEVGLDTEQFMTDLNDQELMYNIVNKYFAASEMGIRSTPSLFLNGERLAHTVVYEDLVDRIIENS